MPRWLNSKLPQFIDRRRDAAVMARVQVEGDELQFEDRQGGRHCVALADIRRVVAVRCEAHAGDEALLLMELPGHAVLPAGPSCQGWPPLCRALERGLPAALPWAEWHALLLAGAVGQPLDVWPPALPGRPTPAMKGVTAPPATNSGRGGAVPRELV